MDSEINLRKKIIRQIDFTKTKSHGYWDRDSFNKWSELCLDLLEKYRGIDSEELTEFRKRYEEAIGSGTDDRLFSNKIASCITILKKAVKD